MPRSPLAIQTTTLGRRRGLLESAMGRAYLAACSPATRETLAVMARGQSNQDAGEVIRQTIEQGYGLRLARRTGESATLAVPIPGDDEPLAVVSLTTFGNMMNADFIDRYLPSLKTTAEDIRMAYLAHIGG
jgi:IclR family mhp operon transcriptional activator